MALMFSATYHHYILGLYNQATLTLPHNDFPLIYLGTTSLH